MISQLRIPQSSGCSHIIDKILRWVYTNCTSEPLRLCRLTDGGCHP